MKLKTPETTQRIAPASDALSSLRGSGAIKPMPEAEIAKAVQLLDLMLAFFAGDGHWARGCYDDGNGGHCFVGALLHLSRKHSLPTAPAIALLQDAMPRPRPSACSLQRHALRQRRRAALRHHQSPPTRA